MEKTFLMVKPDGVKRKLLGKIIGRMEAKGFTLAAIRTLVISPALAAEHYKEHRGQPYYEELITFICSGTVVAMIWNGDDIIALTRQMLGHRNPLQALPGTIRGDYAYCCTENLAHAADSPQAAAREIDLFFGEASR